MSKRFINVFNDSYELYEFCVKNEWTNLDYEEWSECGGELAFFEGDPDIIKIDGVTGYFCECGDVVFYYFDEWYGDARAMLEAFYNAHQTGVTLGGYSWMSGHNPEGVVDLDAEGGNLWDAWDELETGIAWRGGAGYVYFLFDWTEWAEKHLQTA